MLPRRPCSRLEITSEDVQRVLALTVEDISGREQEGKRGGKGEELQDGFLRAKQRQSEATVPERVGSLLSSYNIKSQSSSNRNKP